MKTLLIFSDWYLPGEKAGGPVRSLASLVHHLKEDFQMYIFTRNTDYLDAKPYSSVKSDTWIKNENVQLFYCSSSNLNATTIKNILTQLNPDVVYLNSMFSFYFSLLPLFFAGKRKTVLAPRGMLANGALSVKANKKKLFLLLAKQIKLFNNIIFHATNEQEKQDIQTYFPNNKIEIIPNIPHNRGEKITPRKEKDKNALHLIFIGRIAREKNVLFAAEILSEIKFPVEIDFYGAVYNKDYWNKCQEILNKSKSIKWNYKGVFTNNDFEKVISKYDALFLPTLGENYGHAIVECLSAGVPVIISDKTPWSDIADFNAGWAIPLSDKKKYISAILKIYNMPQNDYENYAMGAKQYFKNRVVNSLSYKKYVELFNTN